MISVMVKLLELDAIIVSPLAMLSRSWMTERLIASDSGTHLLHELEIRLSIICHTNAESQYQNRTAQKMHNYLHDEPCLLNGRAPVFRSKETDFSVHMAFQSVTLPEFGHRKLCIPQLDGILVNQVDGSSA
jgi:hypothetical protein